MIGLNSVVPSTSEMGMLNTWEAVLLFSILRVPDPRMSIPALPVRLKVRAPEAVLSNVSVRT